MELTDRELWAIVGGLVIGTLVLLAMVGSLAAFWTIKQRLVDADPSMERISAVDGDIAVDREGRRRSFQVGLRLTSSGLHPWPAMCGSKHRSIRSRSFNP